MSPVKACGKLSDATFLWGDKKTKQKQFKQVCKINKYK